MEKELLFALISSVFLIIGVVPYFRDVIGWRTFPHPFSYFVWFILTGFNTGVLFLQWEYISFVPALLNTFSCIIFTLYGIRVLKKIQINSFDYTFLVLALLLLPFYFYTKDLLLTVIFSVIIDFLGYLPTIKKWWLTPWTESILIYFMSAVGQVATLLSLSRDSKISKMHSSGDIFSLRISPFSSW